MRTDTVKTEKNRYPLIILDTAVIGSGCAGFNAADWLYALGRTDSAVFTEGVNMGTSRNTGSDKQTYYKLSLSGGEGDSVSQMADTLFDGFAVHGDTALAEAANSVRCFIKLANLGVPFPVNEYGEYAGYKTDHDPRRRATSAGPLTSKYMTEALERAVREKGVRIFDGFTVFDLLVRDGKIEGFLCVDESALNGPDSGIRIVRANHVILATGGPAGCYSESVYPVSQTGMSGMALRAGAHGNNLQEWQYGIASTRFRWNLSGTYQQALPRYVSVDGAGAEREFLPDYFESPAAALDAVFLKGYQWPFDVRNIPGSSMIDLIVQNEQFRLGRRVFLDFRSDPKGLKSGFEPLGEEAYRYLSNSGALVKTPLKRLEKMNRPAIDLYLDNGIDLSREMLEISVSAQHHNGGLAVDSDWQTNISGLYAAGEAAGTFGVSRPGGSALNSAQVGGMRAAQHIARQAAGEAGASNAFRASSGAAADGWNERLRRAAAKGSGHGGVFAARLSFQRKMSESAAFLRDIPSMTQLERELAVQLESFFSSARLSDVREIPALLKNLDIFTTQRAVLSAMILAARKFGSRGSSLVLPGSSPPDLFNPDTLPPVRPPNPKENAAVLTRMENGAPLSVPIPVRPLPSPDRWFETVWADYRKRSGQDPSFRSRTVTNKRHPKGEPHYVNLRRTNRGT